MIGEAIRLALEAHKGQMYGRHPYVYHLRQVATVVEREIIKGEMWDIYDLAMSAAWLHDAVEDADDSREVGKRLRQIDNDLCAVVGLLTSPWGNRAHRSNVMAARMRQAATVLATTDDWSIAGRAAAVSLVKVADRLVNIRNCVLDGDPRLEMYRREHAAFEDAARVQGRCDDLWEEMETLLERDADEGAINLPGQPSTWDDSTYPTDG